MRRICAIIIVSLLSSGATQAQSASTTSGLGATSPLGMFGSNAASGTGVPLGATEIDPGGLSPLGACVPSDPSMQGTSAAGSTSSGSTFDGGGLAGTISAASSCTTGTNVTSTGTASPLSGSPSSVASGTIPLGATELDNGGLSPLITVPAPGFSTSGSTTGCAGSLTTAAGPTTSVNLGTMPGC